MDRISEQRLALCHPTLREKVQAAAKLCEAQGVYIRVVSGLRSYEEQDQLFFSCHHPDGTRDFTKPWKTNARGGWSNHNFGMAVDVAPSMHGKNVPFDPDWNEVHPAFKIMIQELKAQGLEATESARALFRHRHPRHIHHHTRRACRRTLKTDQPSRHCCPQVLPRPGFQSGHLETESST
jgi:hypothetical protein